MTAPQGPDWGADPDADPTTAPAADEQPTALFPNFETWVVEWLIATIHRPLRGGVMWCPQWWRHEEAAVRLDALWRAWEMARIEGGSAMSYWWDMHFDAHWAALSSDQGPFAACKDQVHSDKLTALPTAAPPEGWKFLHDVDEGGFR